MTGCLESKIFNSCVTKSWQSPAITCDSRLESEYFRHEPTSFRI